MTPNVQQLRHISVPVPGSALDEILEAVAFAFGVTVKDLLLGCRSKSLTEARLAAYLIARRCTRLSSPEIGRAIGNRDHSTILAGVKSAEKLAKADTWFAATVRILLERFEVQESKTQ